MIQAIGGRFTISVNTVPSTLWFPGNGKITRFDSAEVIANLWGFPFFLGLIVFALEYIELEKARLMKEDI